MWAIFASFFMMLGIGIWVGIALGLAGLILFQVATGSIVAVLTSAWDIMFSFSLIAIPLYILLGEIFVSAGLSRKIYNAMAPLLDRLPGRLLLTNVAVCTIFGAISGSSLATAAAIGSIAYPELSRRGYDRKAIVGNLASSGTLGLLIPPSFTLILYGAWQEISVGGLFIAAVIPGLIMASLFLIYVMIQTSLNKKLVPPATEKPVPLGKAILATKGIWPMAILIFCVLGTIYLGLATPSEAAGLGVIAAFFIALFTKGMSIKKLYNALIETVKVQGLIGIIIIGAIVFSVAVATSGLPRQVVLGIGDLELSPLLVKICIFVLYLILGCFLDSIGMLLMTLPFTFPLMMSTGAHPYWFGVVLVIVTEMGLLTPPVGMNLYVIKGITQGEVSLGEVAIGAFPYFCIQGVVLALITAFPELCLWLPRLLNY